MKQWSQVSGMAGSPEEGTGNLDGKVQEFRNKNRGVHVIIHLTFFKLDIRVTSYNA